MEGKELKVPEKTLGDSGVELIRAIGASVPVVGSTFSQLIRTNEEIEKGFFLGEVARRINALESMSEQTLFFRANNGDEKAAERIVKEWRRLADAFAKASRESKKEALRQAALSVALSTGDTQEKEVEQDLFMKLVIEFDGIHLRLLAAARYINDVKEIVYSVDGEPMGAFAPEGRNPHPILPCQKAWEDLYGYGLVNTDTVDCIMTAKGYEQENRTPVGIRFLEFITGRKETDA